ncbi:cytochrome o ubiquinol oxidase subunit IV [Stakelama sediminis]|uniref:Cytochrome bo(3) ubiquinol oxidase subunit 4 n=1 Tax=Stakelama sediminis TaxID=463200 RepID=A0A840YWL0_9SPHN|nr:cytochrome C oxidase subunit IV family protein [Stakelama sediminis]MBB5717939.1 cytochrome o ubiquinol oxidase operon protein cyoD [Stakelama sediminis]
MNQEDRAEYRRELRSYIIGLIAALVLTAASFATVHWRLFSAPTGILIAIYLLALVQIIAHFRYFLHIDLRKSARDDLQLILFSTMIVLLMVGGTLIVLFNLKSRMF